MKRLTTILLSGSFLVAPALAADLPPPEPEALTVRPKARIVNRVVKVEKKRAEPRIEKAVARPPAAEQKLQAKMSKDGVNVVLSCTTDPVDVCKVEQPGTKKRLVLGKGGLENFKKHVAEARKNGWK